MAAPTNLQLAVPTGHGYNGAVVLCADGLFYTAVGGYVVVPMSAATPLFAAGYRATGTVS